MAKIKRARKAKPKARKARVTARAPKAKAPKLSFAGRVWKSIVG